MAKKKNKSIKVKVNVNVRKRPGLFITLAILLIIALVIGYFYKDKIISFVNSYIGSSETSQEESSTIKNEGITYDNFQVHFMELGVYETGDSTYIKAGETDILIDAGATTASAPTIINYVNNYWCYERIKGT